MLRFLLRHVAHGSLGANRTHDLCLIRAAPYPLGDEAMGVAGATQAGEVGLEPATSTMEGWHATDCITDAWSTRRELNPLHPRWHRGILPVNGRMQYAPTGAWSDRR